ncbi:GGDEF domain-containing protein [Asticcacaulis taihuensis]|uniref:GGDEF domain-containing protein n=1 Tax=Asticcacaulis taihuensis TaxID=260084 RepID=UPI003F7B53E6
MCYFLLFASAYFLLNTLFYRVQGDPGLVPALSLMTLLLCIGAWAYNRQKPSLVRLEITGHVVGFAFIANALLDIYADYQPIKLMYLVLLVPAFAASGVRPRVVYATSIASIGGLLYAAYQFDPAQVMSCVWVAFAALVVAIGLSSVTRSTMLKAVRARINADINRDKAISLARYDPLTTLPNRRAFLTALNDHLTNGDNFFLGLIDLDGFKPINDIYGHSAGDQVLCEVAKRLQQVCEDRTVVARLGGDEFAVILPAADEIELLAWRNPIRLMMKRPICLPLSASQNASLMTKAPLAYWSAPIMRFMKPRSKAAA